MASFAPGFNPGTVTTRRTGKTNPDQTGGWGRLPNPMEKNLPSDPRVLDMGRVTPMNPVPPPTTIGGPGGVAPGSEGAVSSINNPIATTINNMRPIPPMAPPIGMPPTGGFGGFTNMPTPGAPPPMTGIQRRGGLGRRRPNPGNPLLDSLRRAGGWVS